MFLTINQYIEAVILPSNPTPSPPPPTHLQPPPLPPPNPPPPPTPTPTPTPSPTPPPCSLGDPSFLEKNELLFQVEFYLSSFFGPS